MALRTSSYVIYVDLPSDRDRVLLVHGYAGTYDEVSRSVAAYLRHLEVANVPKPLYGEWLTEPVAADDLAEPSQATIERLRKRGYLTDKSVADELALFERLASALHEAQRRTMPAYVIMPTYDCNLRCGYCFQDHMRTDAAYRHLLRPMSTETADRILSALPSIEHDFHDMDDARPVRNFTFFGGEPLLRASYPIVEHIVRGARRMGPASFGAVTNGTELEAYAALLGPDLISWVQITIDGPPEHHDKRRIHADRSGSFAKIRANVDLALALAVDVIVRINVDRANAHELGELAGLIESFGWSRQPRFTAYLAPVQDYSGTGNAGTRPDFFNSWELGRMLDELHGADSRTRVFRGVDGAMKARATSVFGSRGGMQYRPSFCGAHNGMYIFDSFGDIYACWDRTGDEKLRIGRLAPNGGVVLNGLARSWRSRSVTSNATCRRCRFALNCGGGCAVLAEGASGTIFSNFCDAYGKRFRAKVAESYSEFLVREAAQSQPVGTASALREEFLR